MKAVVVSGEPETASAHYRVANLAETLESTGIQTRTMTISSANAAIETVSRANLLVLARTPWDESVDTIVSAARKNGAAVVFDTDDLVFRPEFARADVIDAIRTEGYAEREVGEYYARMAQTLAAVDWAWCATAELASWVDRCGRPAIVLPNGYNASALRAASRIRNHPGSRDRLLRIGYAAGTRTHQRDFHAAASALASVLAVRSDCRLVLFRSAEGHPMVDIEEFEPMGRVRHRIE